MNFVLLRIKNILSRILSPITNILRGVLYRILQPSLKSVIDNHEVFVMQRFDQVKEVLFKLAEKQQELEHSVLHKKFSDKPLSQDAVFISNGLLNKDSYLEFALEGEEESLSLIKNKYQVDAWYYLFEKLFRGSEEDILNRQAKYLNYLKEAYSKLKQSYPQKQFLDFGFGRGEFLSLVSSSGIPISGVDTNRLNYDRSKKRNLNVFCEDGISFLEKSEDNSFYGVVMYQVAEHISFENMTSLMDLIYKKLVPGGLVLIETVNPVCDYSMKYFYLDPTHIKPHHPEALRFYSEWVGFEKFKILYYQPLDEWGKMNDVTNYLGYSLIGYKTEAIS